MLDDVTLGAIIVSGVALAILILWEVVLSKKAKVFKLIQGPLVAVMFGVGYQVLMRRIAPDLALSEDHLVEVPAYGSFAEIKGNLSHPTLAAFGTAQVWVTGVTIAIVASLETLLCVEATDKLDPYKRTTPTNRELVAQGAGNLASGLIGGLPITQVIVRSSANIQSGGRTKLSAILHGFFILIAVLAVPQILNLVPLAALAAVLFVVGYKLAKPATFVQMYKRGPAQFVPFVVTVVGIVRTDLLTGIAIGMAVAIFFILLGHYRNSHFLHIEQSGGGLRTATGPDAPRGGGQLPQQGRASEGTRRHRGRLQPDPRRLRDAADRLRRARDHRGLRGERRASRDHRRAHRELLAAGANDRR